MPYDLVFDISGRLVKVQVKAAWYYQPDDAWLVDTRRTQTNRREMKRSRYTDADFDFALVHLDELDLFYVFPSAVFNAFGSSISLVETSKRQRQPRSAIYRDAWALISAGLHGEKSLCEHLPNSGKPPAVVIPSQARTSGVREGVET
jgi:hypothetical protein